MQSVPYKIDLKVSVLQQTQTQKISFRVELCQKAHPLKILGNYTILQSQDKEDIRTSPESCLFKQLRK